MSEVVYTDSDLKVGIGIEEVAIPGISTVPAPSLEDNVNVKHEENLGTDSNTLENYGAVNVRMNNLHIYEASPFLGDRGKSWEGSRLPAGVYTVN